MSEQQDRRGRQDGRKGEGQRDRPSRPEGRELDNFNRVRVGTPLADLQNLRTGKWNDIPCLVIRNFGVIPVLDCRQVALEAYARMGDARQHLANLEKGQEALVVTGDASLIAGVAEKIEEAKAAIAECEQQLQGTFSQPACVRVFRTGGRYEAVLTEAQGKEREVTVHFFSQPWPEGAGEQPAVFTSSMNPQEAGRVRYFIAYRDRAISFIVISGPQHVATVSLLLRESSQRCLIFSLDLRADGEVHIQERTYKNGGLAKEDLGLKEAEEGPMADRLRDIRGQLDVQEVKDLAEVSAAAVETDDAPAKKKPPAKKKAPPDPNVVVESEPVVLPEVDAKGRRADRMAAGAGKEAARRVQKEAAGNE